MADWSVPALRGQLVETEGVSFWDLLENALTADVTRLAATNAIDGATITIGELRRQADSLAHAVRRARPGAIGVCADPSIDMLVALVGLARQGISYVAIDPSLSTDRLAFIIQNSGIDTVVVSSRQRQQVDLSTLKVIDIAALPASDGPFREYQIESKNPETDAAILYTSGSTGKPRGVRLSFRALMNRLTWQWQQYPFQDNEIVGARTKIGFVDSLAETWAPFLRATPIIYISPSIIARPLQVLGVIDRYQISLITVVPSLLQLLLLAVVEADTKLPSLKQVISSGDMLTMDLCERFFDCLPGRSLANYYGMTEMMGDVSGIFYEDLTQVKKYAYHNFVSVGSIINNTTMFLCNIDDQGVGELVFSGSNLATGFLDTNKDDRLIPLSDIGYTDGKSVCFRTGDRGIVIDDKLVVVGRMDRQIKIGGNRVDLNEIEAVVQKSFDFDIPPALVSYRERIFACYEQAPKSGWDLGLDRIKRWLPSYAVPDFVQVSSIPKLPISGKIDRRSLEEGLRQKEEESLRQQKEVLHDLPAGVMSTLSSLLHALEAAGIDVSDSETLLKENFFDIGGTSLNALAVMQNLQKLGYAISFEQFFSTLPLQALLEDMSEVKKTAEPVKDHVKAICDRNKWSILPIGSSNKDAAATLVGLGLNREVLVNSLPLSRDRDYSTRIGTQTTGVMHAFSPYFSRTAPEDYISVGLQNASGQLIAAYLALSDDYQPSPEAFPELPDIGLVLEFLDQAEIPVVEKLKQQGVKSIMHGMTLGVDWDLVPEPRLRAEAVVVIEQQLLNVARARGYEAVVSVNTSRTTCDTAVYLGYTVANTIENLQSYKNEQGQTAFPFAPSDAIVTVCYYMLR